VNIRKNCWGDVVRPGDGGSPGSGGASPYLRRGLSGVAPACDVKPHALGTADRYTPPGLKIEHEDDYLGVARGEKTPGERSG
jgi:hypothetical protein